MCSTGLHHHAHQTEPAHRRALHRHRRARRITCSGICHLLGYRFAPTNQGPEGPQTLYAIEKPGAWPLLEAVDRRHGRDGSAHPRAMDRTHAAQGLHRNRCGRAVRHPAQAGWRRAAATPYREALASASAASNERCSPCNGYLIRRCASAATPVSIRARPATRCGARYSFTVRGKFRDRTFENQSFRASGPESASLPLSFIGTRSISTALSGSYGRRESTVPDESASPCRTPRMGAYRADWRLCLDRGKRPHRRRLRPLREPVRSRCSSPCARLSVQF